ncbi:uncharacterized protein LOC111640468 [Centruroides sculpturatus]|uniref:uncharacterized protein LOC111640468 n=1 Tax=Centruroides sculpturatus TaxID=218467 RepID=UPI000C6ED1F3|nr:uncharacterized protein LOC111640468 [Centruroides sculpturatus]
MSGLLCELVLHSLEKHVVNSLKKDIVFYKGYVDDVCVIWRKGERIHEFLHAVNSTNNDGLKLKLEQKSHERIHFLDIDIQLKGDCITRSIYIKPTHSPLYIPANTNDPYGYKMSAFRALIRRAFTYCSNVLDRIKEIDRIEEVASKLGYRKSTIEGLIKSYERGERLRTGTDQFKITKFTYNKHFRNIMKQVSDKRHSKIVYKKGPNLYSILRNDKDRLKKEETASVYKIPFKNQHLGIMKDYIGVTRRNLASMLKEYRYDISKGHCTTVLSSMAQAEVSLVKWNEASILKTVRFQLLALQHEKIEIYKSKLRDGCINVRDAGGLASAWKFFVKEKLKNKNS